MNSLPATGEPRADGSGTSASGACGGENMALAAIAPMGCVDPQQQTAAFGNRIETISFETITRVRAPLCNKDRPGPFSRLVERRD